MTYRTPPMTHPNVTFDVQCWSARESKCLHMSIDHSLVHGTIHAPRALELGNELLIHWTSMMIDELDLLVGTIVSIAIIHHNVESIWRNTNRNR